MIDNSIASEYMAHGWSLVNIPPGKKGPLTAGWNKRGAACKSPPPAPCGMGLAHVYSGTMALDVDDIGLTVRYGIPVREWSEAPDSVIISSGRPGRTKLLYKMPFGLTLPTKRVIIEGLTAFELRCATIEGLTVQDVLPPTIHPDTNAPYVWAGNGDWRNLPTIPGKLIETWNELLATEPFVVQVEGVDASWDEIAEAVSHIDPDCTRDEWIHVGMALHWTGAQLFRLDDGFTIWDKWSARGFKFPGPREIQAQWKSFKSERAQPITLGSLFRIARQHGWVRAMPDASTLFQPTDVITSPAMLNQEMRPLPPDVNLSLWPDLLVTRAMEVSRGVGCDPLVPLFAGLAAVCAVVDAQSRLELMPGYQVPPVLWLMTVGDPGDKKSPGSRPMLAPLKNIETEDRPRFAAAQNDWELKEAAFAVEKKKILDFVVTPEAMLGAEVPLMPERPKEPVSVMLTVSDITSQKLVRHAADRPRGFLCYLDEMNSWTAKIGDKSSGEDRSCWTQAYESEHYKMDRVGAGSIHAENLAVSIYGNIQPAVYRDCMKTLTTDGLLQRFIPAVLRHEKTKRGEPIPDFLSHAGRWENTLRLIYALPPIVYKLSPEAFARFREFQLWYELMMQAERLIKSNNTFMTAVGKLEGLTGRLMLLFHVIEQPFNQVIGVGMVDRVVALVREYVIPAMRYTLGEIGEMTVFDAWLTDHVVAYSDQPSITMATIRDASRYLLKDLGNQQTYATILSGMEVLERASWVSRVDDREKEWRGQAEWLINPRLVEMFAGYRRRVLEARQWMNEKTWVVADSAIPRPLLHGIEEHLGKAPE